MRSSVSDALKEVAAKYNVVFVTSGGVSTPLLMSELMLTMSPDKSGEMILQHCKPREPALEFTHHDFRLDWPGKINLGLGTTVDSLPESFTHACTNQLTQEEMRELQRKNKQRKLKNKRRKARKK